MNKLLTAYGMIITLGAIGAAGCSSEKPVAPAPVTVFESRAAQPATPTTSAVSVDERIVKACGLTTPHFAFDSARVQESSQSELEKIARCFSIGPLARRQLRLVGHADPRGDVEYNFALGHRRAGSIAAYIEQHGVRESQVQTTSRGELDAIGTDEAGWARDRRVDMILVD